MQICGKSGQHFAMVPCLHQSNLYIKRKLREWTALKCTPCFGAESPLRSMGLQSTRFHAASYRADSENLRKLGATFRHGTVFTQIQCLYQGKLRECRAQNCTPCFGAKSPLRSTSLRTFRFHAAPYRADSTNLRQFGATFRHGTVFAPMQCLYRKEAKGMQSPQM